MRSILLSFERRAGRVASVALLGTALVAACDDNRPTEPIAKTPALSPTTASPVLSIGSGVLTWKVVNADNQSLLGGAKFELTGPQNNKWVVQDNGPGDYDPVAGQFKVVGLPAGVYSACEIAAPVGFGIPFLNCKSGTVNRGATTDLGALPNQHLPFVSTGYIDYGKNPIGGGTYTVKDSTGATVMTIVDNGPQDSDKTDGHFAFQLPSAGKFSICETTPPPGYVFPTGQTVFCVTQTFGLGTGTGLGPFPVNPPFSVAWGVVNGFYPPNNTPGWIGPSQFRVTKTNGSVIINTIDNAANDMHLMLGAYHVKLPSAGTYEICEVTPVPNHWMANPGCHTVNVTFGAVAWADYFINGEKQVYKP